MNNSMLDPDRKRRIAMPFLMIGITFSVLGINRNGERDVFVYVGIAFIALGIAFLKASVWKPRKKNDETDISENH